MGQTKSDVLSGTLDLLVLKTLARGTMHGYGITLHIQRVSKMKCCASKRALCIRLYTAWSRMAGFAPS